MIKLRFPLFLNTNHQVQDQNGVLLAGLMSVGQEHMEFADWMLKILNDTMAGGPKLLDSLEPMDVIMRPGKEPLVLVPESKWLEVNQPKKRGNPAFQKGKPSPYAKKTAKSEG